MPLVVLQRRKYRIDVIELADTAEVQKAHAWDAGAGAANPLHIRRGRPRFLRANADDDRTATLRCLTKGDAELLDQFAVGRFDLVWSDAICPQALEPIARPEQNNAMCIDGRIE